MPFKTLNYEMVIHAPAQRVWDLLWTAENYPKWTTFFHPDSTMETDWKIGGKTYFTDGRGNGIVSTISSLDPPHEVIFRHLGLLKDGVEDIKGRDVEEWSGMEEKYFLREIDANTTELRAITHAMAEMEEMLNIGFNEGFAYIKAQAENISV